MNMRQVMIGILFCSVVIHAKMLIIGHRGACGYEPENTLPSFARAIDMGVAMLELDVYVCATGELVVTHDDNVEITTNGFGKVGDITFKDLRKLIVKGIGQIPTLEEVINLVAHRIPINIELKGPGTAIPVAKLIQQYLQQGWEEKDFVVSSFDHQQIQEFNALYPNIVIGVLLSKRKTTLASIQQALHKQANFIGLDVGVVSKEFVDMAHEAGHLVYVWTVNDKKTADVMRSLGVDGIFSNYPDIL